MLCMYRRCHDRKKKLKNRTWAAAEEYETCFARGLGLSATEGAGVKTKGHWSTATRRERSQGTREVYIAHNKPTQEDTSTTPTYEYH